MLCNIILCCLLGLSNVRIMEVADATSPASKSEYEDTEEYKRMTGLGFVAMVADVIDPAVISGKMSFDDFEERSLESLKTLRFPRADANYSADSGQQGVSSVGLSNVRVLEVADDSTPASKRECEDTEVKRVTGLGFVAMVADVFAPMFISGKMRFDDIEERTPEERNLTSSVVVSGTDLKRACGQTKAHGSTAPVYGPNKQMDYELKMEFFTGPATKNGERISIENADEHLAEETRRGRGVVLMNEKRNRFASFVDAVNIGKFTLMNTLARYSDRASSNESKLFGKRIIPAQSTEYETLYVAKETPALQYSMGGLEIDTEARVLDQQSKPIQGLSAAAGTSFGEAEESFRSMVELCVKGTKTVDQGQGNTRKLLRDGDEVIMKARDIQKSEYVHLGAVLGKNFVNTISPRDETMEALEPFNECGVKQNPEPLLYLKRFDSYNFDINLELVIKGSNVYTAATSTDATTTAAKNQYWTMIEQLAHHTVSGYNVNRGDFMGSGTISGETEESCGSIMEMWGKGTKAGDTTKFLLDGDELTMKGIVDNSI